MMIAGAMLLIAAALYFMSCLEAGEPHQYQAIQAEY
jgi:hypothetical protein